MPDARAVGYLVHGAVCRHRLHILRGEYRFAFGMRIFVAVLDEKPRWLRCASAEAARAHECVGSLDAFSVEVDLELAALVLIVCCRVHVVVRRILDLVRAVVPQHHSAAAILAGWDRSLEGVVLDGMILD